MDGKHVSVPRKLSRVVMVLGVLYAVGSVGAALLLSMALPFQSHNPLRNFEVVDVRTRDGVNLSVNQYIAKSRPLVVLAHDAHSSSTKFKQIAPFLLETGYSVLTFDFRGHGESDSATVGRGALEAADVDAVLQHIRSTRGSLRSVAWVGVGAGAAAVTLSEQAQDLGCLVLLDCYTDLQSRLDRDFRDTVHVGAFPLGFLTGTVLEWRLGTPLEAVSPLQALSKLDGLPVLIVQAPGERDAHGRNVGEALLNAAGSQAQLVQHHGDLELLHTLSVEDDTRRAIMAFLARRL